MDSAARDRVVRAAVAPPVSEMSEMRIGRPALGNVTPISGGLGSSKRSLSVLTCHSLSASNRSSSEPTLLNPTKRNSLVRGFIPLNLVTKGLTIGSFRAFNSCRELRSDPWWITEHTKEVLEHTRKEKIIVPPFITCGNELIQKCQKVLKTNVPITVRIWEECGLSDSKKMERFREARNYHKDLWEAMLIEQQSKFSLIPSNNLVVKTEVKSESPLFLDDALVLECMDVLKSFVPKMTLMWEQFKQLNSKKVLWLFEAFCNHKDLWNTMLEEEQKNRHAITKRVHELEMQYRTLCKELGIDHPNFRDTIPLLDKEFWLKQNMAVLVTGKEDRMRCLRVKLGQEEQLCRRLGLSVSPMNQESVPSADELWKLHDRIKDLKDEIATRQLKYEELRDSIRSTKQELDIAIGGSFYCSQFEEDFLISDLSTVDLSDIRMNKLKDLHENLKYQLGLKREENATTKKESEKDQPSASDCSE